MHVLFIVLLVLAIIALVGGIIKPGTNKKTGKPNKRKDLAMVFGFLVVLFIVLTAVTAPKSTNTKPAKTVSSSPKTATQTPTVSITTLNAEATPILTTATNYYSQLLSTGQADAAQSNAANASSAFHQFYEVQTTANSPGVMTGHNAYIKASNLYQNGHQTEPDAISNWDSDAQQTYSDIISWSQDEYLLVVAQLMGNPTANDQAKVTADLQTYNSDLAKTKADISQL